MDKGTIEVSALNKVPEQSVDQLKAAIAQKPVAIALDGADYPFMHYFGGILNDASCGTSQTHHVLAVGYGSENGQDYWLLKNSWGADWGEHGYVRVAINGDGPGVCGMQLDNYWVDLKDY